MPYELFSRIALKVGLPDHKLCAGDVATIVDSHPGKQGQETGYSLEVFNALGETIAVITVGESQIVPLNENEVLHVRQLNEALV